MMQTQAARHFPQTLAAGGDETAQKPAAAEFFNLRPPARQAFQADVRLESLT
jgi:hypothetical protein